ncbi:GerAB/ArcD/ProY family transporter [Alkalihalobacterium elongatum]|uniref:GerAB/ArcD/ProY family transporter n=1 Tax=Alkalihalobacterium elongatum TaxID=2675466 RepID=UPI001C1F7CA9|nr:endospore germination permease [Alkalihalobacterium elongatum]
MENAKINAFQLFVLIVLFELGSAMVLGVGSAAEQDAWIVVLLGMSAGIILFFVYYYLYKQYPTLPLTDYLQLILGKYLGWTIGLFYVIYFLYIGTRVLRDFGDLLLSSTLPETPLFVINLLMICAIAYVLYLGIEVLARTGEFYLLFLLFIGFVTNILIFFAGIFEIDNLLPILGGGLKPVINHTFPTVFTFPFGEMIVFTMLLPYLNQQKTAFKVAISALTFSGVVLAYSACVIIAVLGADIASRSTFPLLAAVGKIRVADFLERLDALVVVTLVIGMFFKIALFIYVGVIGIKRLFNVKNHQKLVFPIGIIILFGSLGIAGNFSEHMEEGLNLVPYYLHLPFQVYIPLVLAFLVLIRKKLFSKNHSVNQHLQ